MLDIQYIIKNTEIVIKQLKTRQINFNFINKLINLVIKRKKIIFQTENLKKNRNMESKNIKNLLSQNKDNKIKKIKIKIIKIKQKVNQLDNLLNKTEKKIKNILDKIPNIPDITVPSNLSNNANIEIRRWGIILNIQNIKNHIEIANKLNIIDFKRGIKLSGSRFVIYKGIGAKLERALINLMLDQHSKDGYIEIVPPILVKPKVMYGTGNLPKFANDAFFLKQENLYLIPTSEVSLINMYSNEILLASQLPIYHSAYTPCFRKEIGSSGQDVKGIIRLHQFHKVEMIKITSEETSFQELEKMVINAENILKILKIPYRVILLCAKNISFSSCKTYDLEVWMPGQHKYKEVSSCSNCKDFQSRRMQMKYRNNKGKTKFTHTLNGSGLAIDRIIAAILENYQNQNGSVNIPDVLQPYLNGIKIIE